MKIVFVNASREYEVIIGSGILDKAGDEILDVVGEHRKVLIVSDDNVSALYLGRTRLALENAGFTEVFDFIFPHGEENKSFDTYSSILSALCEYGFNRGDIVIALGGGVVGDVAGFSASTYMRGIHFVQIPTTLLSAVDSSVGGKTAIDFGGKKNQVGTFYQPSLVLCDIDTLKTLPDEEYKNGCAEVVKYMVLGADILYRPICEQYEDAIAKCLDTKQMFVEADEQDHGVRNYLNFGHTIGHAIEAHSGYKLSHGQAVAIGMAGITRFACKAALCEQGFVDELVSLIEGYGLATRYDAESIADGKSRDEVLNELAELIFSDKKASGDEVTFIIASDFGDYFKLIVSRDNILDLLERADILN